MCNCHVCMAHGMETALSVILVFLFPMTHFTVIPLTNIISIMPTRHMLLLMGNFKQAARSSIKFFLVLITIMRARKVQSVVPGEKKNLGYTFPTLIIMSIQIH